MRGFTASGEAHPDLNLLSACLEPGLPLRRQRLVLAHLAECEACRRLAASANLAREFATLNPAAPGMAEERIPVFALPPESSQLWRWAAPVAAAAIIVAIALVPSRPNSGFIGSAQGSQAADALLASAPHHPGPRLREARRAAAMAPPHRLAAPATAPTVPDVIATAAPPPAATAQINRAALSSPDNYRPSAAGFVDQHAASTIPGAFDPAAGGVGVGAPPALVASAEATMAAPAAAAAMQMGFLSASGSRMQTSPAVFVSSRDARRSAFSLPVNLAGGLVRVLTSKVSFTSAPASPAEDFVPDNSSDLPVWAISSQGELVHSVGAGFWAAVPLHSDSPLTALSVVDSQIWAGGVTSRIFYSRDGGAHFRSLTLEGAQAHPARIVTITFADADHGIITAADGRYWTTLDGGDHWMISVH